MIQEIVIYFISSRIARIIQMISFTSDYEPYSVIRSMNKICLLLIFIFLFFNVSNAQHPDVGQLRLGDSISTEMQLTQVEDRTKSAEQLFIFGHNLFINPNILKLSQLGGGIMFPENYRLGTGDRLGIYLLGKSQQNFDVIVNVEGKIYIPTVGVFHVANQTIDEFNIFLKKTLSKYYDNFSLNIMLIEPKIIPVMVAGDVNRPGKYFLSSLNTVLDAVIMAGGPTATGSLRNIQVYRQDKLIESIDSYQFLISGKIQNENSLQQYDRIVIPLIKDLVSVTGEVKRQAKFELKNLGNERLSDLVYLAGGFTDLAYLNKIEISRLLDNGERTVFYVNYNEILENEDSATNILLKNDDRIHVFSIMDQICPKYVYVHGEVKNPGRYPLEENLHVLDLILKAGNLTRSAFILECEVAKIDPKMPAKFKKIKLQDLFNNTTSEENILLEEDDRLFIRQIPEWEVGWTVEIKGEVQFPGIYAITKDSTQLSEIIEKAGGFTDEALIREASLIRKSSKINIDKEYERLRQLPRDQLSKTEYQYLVMKENTGDIGQIVVDFHKLCVLNDKKEDVILEDGDMINVPKTPDVVYVTGRVGKPGGIVYQAGENMKYYLKKAGGPTWDAKVRSIKITKVTGEIVNDEDVQELEPGDIIWVPRKPDRDWWEIFHQTITITAQIATVYLVINTAIKQ